jgi:hypothetical protein
MTVATTSTHEFDVGKICRLAYMEAGLLNPLQELAEAQAAAARDVLEVITRSVDTEGMFTRVVEFAEVTLATGITTYSLSADVVEVAGAGMYIDPTDTSPAAAETIVKPVSRETWQEISAKNASARPVWVYFDRSTSPGSVKVWPIPSSSENGGTLRLQVQRLRADVNSATVTMDFERYWTEYLIKKLAATLGRHNTLNLGRIQELEAMAADLLRKCKAKSHSQVNQQFVVRHGGRRR